MSARLLALALAASLAPCASAPATSAGGSGDHHGKPPEGREVERARSCPQEGQRCDDYGASCDTGRRRCHCTSPCTGVELMPEESYPRWICRDYDPRCPDAIPEAGQRCRPEGLQCGWGSCGGASAVCEDHEWSVHHYGPPP